MLNVNVRAYALTITLLLACPSILKAQDFSTANQLKQEYVEVLHLVGKQQYDEAIQGLKRIIEKEPFFCDGYLKLIEIYKYKSALSDAREYFKGLITKDPGNASVYHGLGLVYREQGDFQQSIENYRKGIDLGSRCASIYEDIVDAYNESHDLDGAIVYLDKLVRVQEEHDGVYFGLGYAYAQQRLWQQALVALEKALRLNPSLSVAYLEKQNIYYSLGKLQEALEANQAGYNLAKNSHEVELQHRFLNRHALLLKRLGKPQEAQQSIEEALAIARQFGDRGSEGEYLGNRGAIFSSVADYRKALDYYMQALTIAQELGDKPNQVKWLTNMGVAYRNLGGLSEAREHHQQALQLAREIKNRKWEGLNIGNLGSVYLYLAQYSEALAHYEQALAIHREIRDKSYQGTWLVNLGLCYWNLNNYQQALAYFEQALPILREIGDKSEEGRALGGIGLTYWTLGDYSKSLDHSEKALKIAREIGNRSGEARHLAHIGNVYFSLGNYPKALQYEEKAAAIAQEIGDKFQQTAWLGNLGATYHVLGDYQKALDYYDQSLRITREVENAKDEAIFLGNIGLIHAEYADYPQALESFEQAMEIAKKIGDKSGQGYQLINFGELAFKMGDYAKSIEHYAKALAIGKAIKEPVIIWQARAGLALAYDKQGRYRDALTQFEKATALIEGVRNSLLSTESRTSFQAVHVTVYEGLIDLLARLHRREPTTGYDQLAFQYAERARARALLDIIYEGRIFHYMHEIPPDFRQRFLDNETNLRSRHTELSNVLSMVESKTEDGHILSLEHEIEAFEREKTQLLVELKENYPRYHQLTNPRILTVDELQQSILNDNEVLLEYFVGQGRTFVWVLTKERLQFHTIDLSRKKLQERFAHISPLFQKEKNLKDVKIDHRWANLRLDLLNDLYHMLIQKPAEDMLNPRTEFIIVPDDVLHYFPFEILVTKLGRDEVHYLIEEYPISYAASASSLNPELEKVKKAPEELLAFGNPDFGREQSQGIIGWVNSLLPFKSVFRGARFESLPYAELEVRTIAENFEKATVVIGREASERKFKEGAQNYRFIHLATHNITDDKQPMYSKIILAQTDDKNEDGFLQTYEVYNLRLNAELVVLSGCNTGLGRLSRGEGLIGVTRAFLYAGAPSLVVSLWPVNDESTAELMKYFYRNLKADMAKNQALQMAKIELIRSKDWQRDPFYWGAFVLLGDWREVAIK